MIATKALVYFFILFYMSAFCLFFFFFFLNQRKECVMCWLIRTLTARLGPATQTLRLVSLAFVARLFGWEYSFLS